MMKMLHPTDPGINRGDLFYGYADFPGDGGATHQWDGDNWQQLVPEVDEEGPAPAGMDAIPADMPNHEHKAGDIPLPYDLQTFNSLVAANTAMETEISGFAEKEALLREALANMTEARDELKITAHRYYETLTGTRGDLAQAKKAAEQKSDAFKTMEGDLIYARDQRDALQRKLDRTLGFVDRVLDEESVARAPMTQAVPAAQPSVGPALHNIPEARDRRDDRVPSYMAGEAIRVSPAEAYRRY